MLTAATDASWQGPNAGQLAYERSSWEALTEMSGEALREAGVLVVVFYGLGVLLPTHPGLAPGELLGGLASLAIGLFLWWQGVLFSRMAP